MEEIIIHYLDDDADDQNFFMEVVEQIEAFVLLNLYKKHEDLFIALENKRNKKELVILDINMPCKNGIEILKEIRESKSLKKTPVIMYSTCRAPQTISDSLNSGANLFVVKPHTGDELKGILKKIVKINWVEFKTTPENFVLK